MNARKKINLQQWANDLAEQKSSGMTRLEWCRVKGINVNTFDHRCKQVRAALDSISKDGQEETSLAATNHVKPVERRPVEFTKVDLYSSAQTNACIKIRVGNAAVDIFPDATSSHIQTVLEALNYVK